MGGKTRYIAIQLVLQQCCKTSCMFFVARISISLFNTKLKLKSKLLACECRHISHHHFSPPRWKEVTTGNTSARLTYKSLLFSLQTVPATYTECMHTASQHICKEYSSAYAKNVQFNYCILKQPKKCAGLFAQRGQLLFPL